MAMSEIIINKNNVSGTGIFEEPCHAKGNISGFFIIGAYTYISHNCVITDTLIGRYSRIDEECHIGCKQPSFQCFSNSFFSSAENGPFKENKYYQSIKPLRSYREKNKISTIGSDVHIHRGVVIYEGANIADGAIVLANSVVVDDIPPYAIAAGNPAKIIGYRFDENTITDFLKSKWWMKDISICFSDKLDDIVDNLEFFKRVFNESLIDMAVKRLYHRGSTKINYFSETKKIVIGPSHISLLSAYMETKNINPKRFISIGRPGWSLHSDNLYKVILWLTQFFDEIVLFVPDFRIGNSTINKKCRDGTFIQKNSVSNKNDIACYNHAIETLESLKSLKKVKFIFWCLKGREETNKKNNKYIVDGQYRHPIWNYDELVYRFKDNTIDLNDIGVDIVADTQADGTVHPNEHGFTKIINYLETV